MRAGVVVALVSDAGMPLVSDPGYVLVQGCVAAGLEVEVLPGPSAALAALVASALPSDAWRFAGFLPRKRSALIEVLASPETVVAFESPRRVGASLAVLSELDPERPVAVCRELTKVHEEVVRGTLPEVASHFAGEPARGEVTVCVAGRGSAVGTSEARGEIAAAIAALDRDDVRRRYEAMLAGGMSRTDARKQLAADSGVSRREIYRVLLADGRDDPASEEE
jgi:16S rRNA (cytidine1402-2'-O)-methyltransferase